MNHMTPAVEWWRPQAAASVLPGQMAETVPQPAAPGRPAFLALMVFTFVLLLAPQSFIPGLAVLHPALLAAGVAMALHTTGVLSRGEPLLGASPDMRIALALAGWAAITIPLSVWPAGSLGYLVDSFAKTLILFWLLAGIVVTRNRLKQAAWCLALMSTPLALTAVWNLMSGVFVPEGIAPGFARIAGYEAPLTANPNDLALTLNLILPLAAALFLSERRPAPKLLALSIVAIDAVAVIATFSRGGFLTLAVVLMLYFARRAWRTPALLLLPLLLLFCLPLLPSGYLDHMGTIADIASDPTGSAQERWGDIRAATRLALASPITGAGIGMNALAMNAERGATWRMVHNVYLQYAVELGLPGLILFLALLWRAIRRAGAARRLAAGAEPDGFMCHVAEALQTGLIAFAVAACFHPVGYHFYFYYLAGLALGLEAAIMPRAPRRSAARV